MGDDDSAITAEEFATWLAPRAAIPLLNLPTSGTAQRQILGRLTGGLIVAVAETVKYVLQGKENERRLFVIQADLWKSVSEQFEHAEFWMTGDVNLALSRDRYSTVVARCFGVRFKPADVRAMNPTAQEPRRPSPQIPPVPRAEPKPELLPIPTSMGKRGAKPKEFWDDLWVEMCRQIYADGLRHEKLADIEKAMADWAESKGYKAGEATYRRAARKLLAALNGEDQKGS